MIIKEKKTTKNFFFENIMIHKMSLRIKTYSLTFYYYKSRLEKFIIVFVLCYKKIGEGRNYISRIIVFRHSVRQSTKI